MGSEITPAAGGQPPAVRNRYGILPGQRVAGLQRQNAQLGRLRLGYSTPGPNGGKVPHWLKTWRMTTNSRATAEQISERWGGEIKQWERGQWDVITETDHLPVMVPPHDAVIGQAWELWDGGECMRRCDGITEYLGRQQRGKTVTLTGPQPCPCGPDIERKRCQLKTRASVAIPTLPGVGIWRLDTSSMQAAGEMTDAADVLEMARQLGVWTPASLQIQLRTSKTEGQRKNYPVPFLHVEMSVQELLTRTELHGGLKAQQLGGTGSGAPQLAAAGPGVIDARAEHPPALEAPPMPLRAADADDLARQCEAAEDCEEVRQWGELAKRMRVTEHKVHATDEPDRWITVAEHVNECWHRKKCPAG